MINLKNPVIKGSLILLILIGFFNILNFLYQLLMARTLSIEDFGLLKRVFVFLYLGAVLMESLQTIITKYTSTQSSNDSKLKGLLNQSFRKIGYFGLLVFVLFLISSLIISPLFNIPYSLLAFTGIFLIGSMLIPIPRGILQGQQRFYALGFSIISEGILKVVISLLLVLAGLGVYGAVGGVLASIFFSLLISMFYFRKIMKSKEEKPDMEGIRGYSWPVLCITATLILFFNIDVLFAGYFFTDTLAGIYAIASTIAIVIFVGIQPINKVLFPITAKDTAERKPSNRNFSKALALVLACSAVALLVIWIFPELLVNIMSGKSIPEANTIMLILALGTSVLSVTSLILYHKLSQGKTSGYKLIPVFLIVEAILLAIFSGSIFSFALAFLWANIIFLIGSLFLLNR